MDNMNITLGATIDLISPTLDHANKINRLNPPPPLEVSADAIHVRAMKLTGDQLNAQLGKFHSDDLTQLAQKTVGAPVLIGHKKDSSPIARYFDARVSSFTDQGNFVVAAFYWPKADPESPQLVARIDAGIYAEASISFSCARLQCSVCEHDIRSVDCKHYPGKDGVFYYYEEIDTVLEGSIVYRGAHPNTGMVRDFVQLETNPQWKPVFLKRDSDVDLGENLGRFLTRLIDRMAGDDRDRRSEIIDRIAREGRRDRSTIEQIMRGTIQCPHPQPLGAFARVLRVQLGRLIAVARRDGCTRYNED